MFHYYSILVLHLNSFVKVEYISRIDLKVIYNYCFVCLDSYVKLCFAISICKFNEEVTLKIKLNILYILYTNILYTNNKQ